MTYITRTIQSSLQKAVMQGKPITIVYGPRQVGKTTMLRTLFPPGADTIFLSGDELRTQTQLVPDSIALRALFGENKLVIIDEMQYVPDAGRVLKIIADHLPDIRVIATGSSAFNLAQAVSEPMTGRFQQFFLFPFSIPEIVHTGSPVDILPSIQQILIYGSYPDITLTAAIDNKASQLSLLTETYLYKDVLNFEQIRNSQKLRELLTMLALQIGNEVSFHELGTRLGINYKTVARYIDILEQAFIIFRLSAFARNKRNEISRKVKIYFYDCGIRNAIINNFNPLKLRTDGGALFENFIVSAMRIRAANQSPRPNFYFWRTHSGQEIDLISEMGDAIFAYEIKLTAPANYHVPSIFSESYPNIPVQILSLNTLASIRDVLGIK